MAAPTQTNEDWESRACPTCLHAARGLEKKYRGSSPAEVLPFDQVKRRFVGLGNGAQFFTYIRCANCHQLYCPTYFNQSQLTECYSQMPDNLMGAEKRTATINQEGYAKQILTRLTYLPMSYLELGPDVGLLAQTLQKSCNFNLVYFIEPNQIVHEQLRKNLDPESSIEIVSKLDESSANNVDLCIGIHVLDHLLNPGEELSAIHKMLNANGTLALVVHNEKSILRHFLKTKWPPFCLQHPQLFNRTTVTNLLLNLGFRVVQIQRTKNFVRVDNIINNLLEIFGSEIRIPSSKYWPKLSLYFGNILVISRKVS